ncbi:hypothetical protein BDV25DRAFT_43019 [Aspergillus avenaceus]|uniref:Zn(2)-C6 fungal-type domain-containing protein n=1 Tax=Aspergillus avenaceus TaxID=36643 RepID=A0A5N6TKX9_ASPAV|nr:hypothetical protein BDV25DRAFT_43019 [Aspergillus avenaceus]
MAPTETHSKKVRLACRRCRTKRIKCDGSIPACGNCARAKTLCVDVDGRNTGLSIPRDFVTRCYARIKWLEEKIKVLDPHFDLSQGPEVDTTVMDASARRSPTAVTNETAQGQVQAPPPALESASKMSPELTPSAKRSYATVEASDVEQPACVEARSVAIELGMLSLHSDSRQKHYLGSSSGLLFTKLIGLDSEQSSPLSWSSTPTPICPTHRRRAASPRHSSEEAYQHLYSSLGKELPPPEEASVLLEVYFQVIHVDHPFLDPYSVMNAYRALHDCARLGCDGHMGQNGWIDRVEAFPYNGRCDVCAGSEITPITISTATFHLFMVFSLAATVLTRSKRYDHNPDRYYRMAMTVAADCFSSISIPALQGVLLLMVKGLIGPAAINVWTLSYLAMSHCIDLGLHREPTDYSDLSHTALTVRRLIFHTVYSFDRSIATIQGRPLGIRDETFDVRWPTIDDIAQGSWAAARSGGLDIQLPPPEALSLCTYRFRADQHISEIKLLFYRLPEEGNTIIWPTELVRLQEQIKKELDDWLAETSHLQAITDIDDASLRFDCEKLKLEALYHSAITLLFQPSQVFQSPSRRALGLCYQSCRRRLHIFNYLNNKDRLYFTWRNVHGIFSSGATIVYCLWASREQQELTPLAEALSDLRTCSNLLSIGSQWWPSLRRGKESFEKMIDLTIGRLSRLQTAVQPTSPRRAQRRRLGPTTIGDLNLSPLDPPSDVRDLQIQASLPALDEDIAYNVLRKATLDSSSVAQQSLTHTAPCSELSHSNPTTLPASQVNMLYPESIDHSTIDSAMEDFLAEYLHGDWGWDPFSRTAED